MEANDDAQFTIANIPLGIATTADPNLPQHSVDPGIVTRLYGHVYFLSALQQNGLFKAHPFSPEVEDAVQQHSLNKLAGLGRGAHREIRMALQSILSDADSSTISPQLLASRVPVDNAVMHLPITIGDFSDYSCSIDHVLNAGEAATGVRAMPPGFLHFPIGYGGRSSSIMVSGANIARPWGHIRAGGDVNVVFAPSRAVDFELEVACVVGKPSESGRMVSASEAAEHLFGFVLLNDWSARDIQGLEMPPLGPFLGKSFATTISPWVILADALQPFLKPVLPRQKPVSKHFTQDGDKAHYAVALAVDISAAPEDRQDASHAMRVCTSQLEWIYWTISDIIAHQTSNGCAVRPGDLLATGTVSGSEKDSLGCLMEITKGGKEALRMRLGVGGDDDTKIERIYLKDGDRVVLRGWAGEIGSDDCVGFGECAGTLAPAQSWTDSAVLAA